MKKTWIDQYLNLKLWMFTPTSQRLTSFKGIMLIFETYLLSQFDIALVHATSLIAFLH